MSVEDAHADATAILGLMNLPRVGTVTILRILDALAERDTPVRYLLEYDAASLVADELLTEKQAEIFVADLQREWCAATIDQLEAAGVALIPVSSDSYPTCPRDTQRRMMPPLMMVRGNASLLDHGGIAFAGARRSSQRGLDSTRAIVAKAVERAFTVVSGGAAGTDVEAHEEALASGGSTIIVLAEGIGTAHARRFDGLLESGNAAVVSTFLPDDPWHAWRAMERNRTILALCDRLVVIEARVRGGTLEAGKAALAAEMPVWVLDYADPPESAEGNRSLIEHGAHPIPVPKRGEIAVPPELFAIDGWVVKHVRR